MDPSRTQFATDERAKVLAWDDLAGERSHLDSLPLPPTLGSTKEWRRLTATLAWLSPVNARRRNYRQAFPWAELGNRSSAVSAEGGKDQKKSEVDGRTLEALLQVKRAGLDEETSQRGTAQHRVWEGERGRRRSGLWSGSEFESVLISAGADSSGVTRPGRV